MRYVELQTAEAAAAHHRHLPACRSSLLRPLRRQLEDELAGLDEALSSAWPSIPSVPPKPCFSTGWRPGGGSCYFAYTFFMDRYVEGSEDGSCGDGS